MIQLLVMETEKKIFLFTNKEEEGQESIYTISYICSKSYLLKERIMNLKISGWTLLSFKIIIVIVTSEYKCEWQIWYYFVLLQLND